MIFVYALIAALGLIFVIGGYTILVMLHDAKDDKEVLVCKIEKHTAMFGSLAKTVAELEKKSFLAEKENYAIKERLAELEQAVLQKEAVPDESEVNDKYWSSVFNYNPSTHKEG